jgi:hypothetical protein
MKSLLIGVAVILLIGIAGFFYRNMTERNAAPEPVACTMEAKQCPDGSYVGRTGPACEFAACPDGGRATLSGLGISFAVPEGYAANPGAIGDDTTLRAAFEKPAMGDGPAHAIVVRAYPIPAGKGAEDVIVGETIFETSGMGAESIDQFEKETIGGRTFYVVVVERFEAIVHSLYYFPREKDVLRFEALERDVTDWTEPTLSVKSLPEHAALREMLRTLETGE